MPLGTFEVEEVVQLILLMGYQATGKSTFCRERLFHSHLRINLDMLKTRHREWELVTTCLRTQTAFVVDNTNLTRGERGRYIDAARAAGFRIVGYFFESRKADAIRRNALRPDEQRVPEGAIAGSSGRMELPSFDEGFDELKFVRIAPDGGFSVEDWQP